jgi:hypothetical protein
MDGLGWLKEDDAVLSPEVGIVEGVEQWAKQRIMPQLKDNPPPLITIRSSLVFTLAKPYRANCRFTISIPEEHPANNEIIAP